MNNNIVKFSKVSYFLSYLLLSLLLILIFVCFFFFWYLIFFIVRLYKSFIFRSKEECLNNKVKNIALILNSLMSWIPVNTLF
jgi:hypothetical protein